MPLRLQLTSYELGKLIDILKASKSKEKNERVVRNIIGYFNGTLSGMYELVALDDGETLGFDRDGKPMLKRGALWEDKK